MWQNDRRARLNNQQSLVNADLYSCSNQCVICYVQLPNMMTCAATNVNWYVDQRSRKTWHGSQQSGLQRCWGMWSQAWSPISCACVYVFSCIIMCVATRYLAKKMEAHLHRKFFQCFYEVNFVAKLARTCRSVRCRMQVVSIYHYHVILLEGVIWGPKWVCLWHAPRVWSPRRAVFKLSIKW